MIYAAVLGYGTVGSGIVSTMQENAEIIEKNAGEPVRVKYVCDLREFPDDPISDILVKDTDVIFNDTEISVVFEALGGLNPAFEFTKRALEAGKHVCTSNKEVVERYGAELLGLAKKHKCHYLFEASVGGGIPLIRGISESLVADRIDRIIGILNGTTNFILTKMVNEGADFSHVLKEAQDLGYAEKDPTADIEGFDPGRKIAILSSIMYGQDVSFENIHIEGIKGITPNDFIYAKQLDCSIKLLAISERAGSDRFAVVAPYLIKNDHPLALVSGVFNACMVTGNMVGDVMFYGQGAGKLATASAMVSDLVNAVRNPKGKDFATWDKQPCELTPHADAKRRFFVRLQGNPQIDMADVRGHFGNVVLVNILDLQEEFGFITDLISEEECMEKLDSLGGVLSVYRML